MDNHTNLQDAFLDEEVSAHDRALRNVLDAMHQNSLSLSTFLSRIFSSNDKAVQRRVGCFVRNNGPTMLLQNWLSSGRLRRDLRTTIENEAIRIFKNETRALVQTDSLRVPTGEITCRDFENFFF